MDLEKTAQSAIEYSFKFLFFMVPLIMTPWNFELFEYNKMMLTYAVTCVIIAGWLSKMIVTQKIIFRKSAFDIPLVIFFLFQLTSTLFSIDQHTSIWGYYSRFHGGLVSTIAYLLLYWALVSNLNKARVWSSLRWLLASSSLVAIYGVLEHFGIDAQYWVQDVKNRVFSTLGQPNWLAAFLATLLPLPLAIAYNNKKNKPRLALWLSVFALFALCLVYTKSRSGIPAAIIAFAFFLYFAFSQKIISFKKQLLLNLGVLGVVLITSLFVVAKFYPSAITDTRYIFGLDNRINIQFQKHGEGGTASSDIRKIVWRGAFDIFRAYPLFGSGVETFAYSYYQYRPVEHNLISEWDFLYNKAHNEYFNFLATTGGLGFASYLLLIGWFCVWSYRKLQALKTKDTDYYLMASLFAGWLSILITNFFGFSVVPVALLFFLIPAFLYILTSKDEEKPVAPAPIFVKKQKLTQQLKPEVGGGSYLALGVTWLLTGYLTLQIWNMWQADKAFAEGNKLNKQGEYALAYNLLQKAIKLNPSEPNYYEEIAWSAANLAYLFHSQKDTNNGNMMINLALESSKKSLEISPRHLNYYRTQAKIYYKLASIDGKYVQSARETLKKAAELAPTEAKITYNLGLVYEALGQRQEATKTMEKTVEMKTNYVEARQALALLYKEEGQQNKAIEQYEYLLAKVYPNSQEIQQSLNELKTK